MKKILVQAHKDTIRKQCFTLNDFQKKYKLKKIFPLTNQSKFKRFSNKLKKSAEMTRNFVSGQSCINRNWFIIIAHNFYYSLLHWTRSTLLSYVQLHSVWWEQFFIQFCWNRAPHLWNRKEIRQNRCWVVISWWKRWLILHSFINLIWIIPS